MSFRARCTASTRAAVALLAIFLVVSASAQTPYLNITPTPPKELAPNASLEDTAKFAWQEFLALQWKASVGPGAPPSPSNPRGRPDPKWNHGMPTPKYPQPLVWQTYAQTTELRPNGPLTIPWSNLGIPKYSYYTAPVPGNPTAAFNLWNNLDEDSEIGSCNIYGQYKAQKSPRELVLFQVKVNRDEYEWLRTNYGQWQHCAPASVIRSGSAKSYPSCASIGANGGTLATAQAGVLKRVNKPPYTYFPGQTSYCNCPPNKAICLPCGSANGSEGAIEVKSAWRRLLPNENPARYYTTTALYYDVNPSAPNGPLLYFNGTFALIGMHIIHKTANYPSFVFATFEHVDVERSDMEFVATTNAVETGPAVPVIRQQGQSNQGQNHPVPPILDQVTARVRAQLLAMNKSTAWQYYRLTGVQAQPIDVPVSLNGLPPTTEHCICKQNPVVATQKNPNYFMANFVIESDPFLNNFTGPGFGANGGPIFTAPGVTGCENMVSNGRPLTIGGCKGCHGVAQSAFGTDFSFLLDFGNNKPSIVPAAIHYLPPAGAARRAALRNFMDGTKPK